MSKSLSIDRVNGQPSERLLPVSTEEVFYRYWYPAIEQEGYPWLNMMAGGFEINASNIAEVLAELRQFQGTLPKYFAPDHEEYAYITRRLAGLIAELEALQGQEVELYLG